MNSYAVSLFMGITGSIMTIAFGGWDQLLTIFIITIGIDYITGLVASIREGSGLDSKVGFWGITRKFMMFLVIILAHQIDLMVGNELSVIKNGAVYFYMANELISITENYGRMGLPLPSKLRKVIAVLKNKDDSNKE